MSSCAISAESAVSSSVPLGVHAQGVLAGAERLLQHPVEELAHRPAGPGAEREHHAEQHPGRDEVRIDVAGARTSAEERQVEVGEGARHLERRERPDHRHLRRHEDAVRASRGEEADHHRQRDEGVGDRALQPAGGEGERGLADHDGREVHRHGGAGEPGAPEAQGLHHEEGRHRQHHREHEDSAPARRLGQREVEGEREQHRNEDQPDGRHAAVQARSSWR